MLKAPILFVLAGLGSSALLAGCLNAADVGPGGTDAGGGPGLPPLDMQGPQDSVGMTVGVRPMSIREFDNSMAALLLDTTQPGAAALPADAAPAFDNVFDDSGAIIIKAKVEDLETLAKTIADRFLADDARVKAVLPCVPTSASDQACLTKTVGQLGLLFYRRPLTTDEANDLLALTNEYASGGTSYKAGLQVLLRVLLQHPYFLYRTELGTLVDADTGTYQLDDFELASKLSFTLWGTSPSLSLLNDAAAGKLADATYLGDLVDQMLKDERAASLVDYFHAGWLGYDSLTSNPNNAGIPVAVRASMRAENKALVKRVVFDEGRPWLDLFDLDEVFADKTLANYYGLPQPADAGGAWVKQTDAMRKGILGTGAFLSYHPVTTAGETSVALRGKNIRNQLLCEDIPPPPINVQTDQLPTDSVHPSPCKIANIMGTTLDPTKVCVGCHTEMDSVGLGLENYDTLGLFRATEPNLPQCTIDGQGQLAGHGGAFRGPAALADLVTQSGRVDYCMAQRWLQFTNGTKSDPKISAMTDVAVAELRKNKDMKSFLRAQLLDPTFRLRHVF